MRSSARGRNANGAAAIVAGSGIAGVLDIAYAILLYSPSAPILIPQTIASGILGERSYQGGTESAALGIVLHFFIALCSATVYWFASRMLKALTDHAILGGLGYGAIVYLVMHLIVLPLSAVPRGDGLSLEYKTFEFVEHMICVGLPIALTARYYSARSA